MIVKKRKKRNVALRWIRSPTFTFRFNHHFSKICFRCNHLHRLICLLQAQNVAKDFRHTASFEVEDADFINILDILTTVLNEKEISESQSAKYALKKLKEVQIYVSPCCFTVFCFVFDGSF